MHDRNSIQMTSGQQNEYPVGGVFPLEAISSSTVHKSVLSCWSQNAKSTQYFHNARSALRYILINRSIKRLWLPAFVCSELVSTTANLPTRLRYFPVDDNLIPNTQWLTSQLRRGDAVLAINYFGQPSSNSWLSVKEQYSYVEWIEDCAHTIDINQSHFGDYRIYSPRKILGVPDGGVLVDVHGRLSIACLRESADNVFMLPSQLRAQDPAGENHASWFQAFQIAEDSMKATNEAMSQTTKSILVNTRLNDLRRSRIENFSQLLKDLRDIAFIRERPRGWIPFGFPLKTKHVDALCAFLAKERIFVPRHWRNIPSSKKDFAVEHRLSQQIMTLPCDQRYTTTDMRRVASLVLDFLQ